MTEICEEKYDDINTITSLLKLYFRLLPIPLITFDIYFQVIDIVREYTLPLVARVLVHITVSRSCVYLTFVAGREDLTRVRHLSQAVKT